MKTEARKILSNLNDGRITVSQATEQVMYLVEQAQKEAYNQAIDDALEEIDDYKLEYDDFNDFSAGVSSIPNKDKQSILKLKK